MIGKEKRGNKAMKQDFIITKERIDEIGKHLETIYLVHRNVENDTKLTKEEKMIQELYDNYLNLLIKYNEQKEIIDKINNYLNNYDVFKVFSFPLMKRWEEEQIKSSIDYEFKTSLVKDLKDILKEVSE